MRKKQKDIGTWLTGNCFSASRAVRTFSQTEKTWMCGWRGRLGDGMETVGRCSLWPGISFLAPLGADWGGGGRKLALTRPAGRIRWRPSPIRFTLAFRRASLEAAGCCDTFMRLSHISRVTITTVEGVLSSHAPWKSTRVARHCLYTRGQDRCLTVSCAHRRLLRPGSAATTLHPGYAPSFVYSSFSSLTFSFIQSFTLSGFFFHFFVLAFIFSSILLFFCSFMSCCVRLLFRQVLRSFVL